MFELAPPLTQTPLLTKGFQAKDVMGVRAMDVMTRVDHAIKGLKRDQLEIRPGLSDVLPSDWHVQEHRWDLYHWLRSSGLIVAFVLLALGLAAR